MNDFEERLYEIAGQEIASKEVNRGIWAKAFSEASGEISKTQALYIRLRVESLRRAAEEETARITKESKERRLTEREKIERKIKRFQSLPYCDTDHISRNKFVGSKQSLSTPISTAKAAELMGILEFEIIDLIKLEYLNGVYDHSQWYFELEN